MPLSWAVAKNVWMKFNQALEIKKTKDGQVEQKVGEKIFNFQPILAVLQKWAVGDGTRGTTPASAI